MQMTSRAEIERRALDTISGLASLDDGSGWIKDELIAFLDSLGDDLYRYPRLRREGHCLLGVVLIGLEEDDAVADLFNRTAKDCTLYSSDLMAMPAVQEAIDAAKTVIIHMLRAMARMEAVELKELVEKQIEVPGLPPAVVVALRMTNDLLGAASLDAHPDDMVRVVQRYADSVMFAGDVDLLAYFMEVERYVENRERQLKFGMWE
ncbi:MULTISPECIES: hypothetical protein [unclassified Corynebacterium]|uniref:hypothetical protein n=1 Tax=unclassified Corynebacterium TaxID=2624378 RepID=UPI0030B2BDA7